MNTVKTNIKKGVLVSVILTLLLFFFINIANYIICYKSQTLLYASIKEVPYNKVGLLLGTSKYAISGQVNPFYKYRVNAAYELFKNNKIDYILVSGDNSTNYYNEPKKFKEDLISKGIPENRIILDYAGFRTLDSVVRANEVFKENNITVISQKFHNERAVYLAYKHNINAIGYNAKDVSGKYGLKTHLREYLARVKVFIDLLFNIQPKFLGDPILIPEVTS